MKVIPGSNPPMYIEENGSIKDQFFSKVPHEYDSEDGDAYVKVAGKKRYVGALILETYGDDPRAARSGESFRFKDEDRRNFAPDNVEYYRTTKGQDTDGENYGRIDEVGEAGKVDSDDVPDIPDEDLNEEDSTVNKKDLIKAAFMANEKATYNEVIEGIKEDHKVEVSSAYVANVKKELGLTGK